MPPAARARDGQDLGPSAPFGLKPPRRRADELCDPPPSPGSPPPKCSPLARLPSWRPAPARCWPRPPPSPPTTANRRRSTSRRPARRRPRPEAAAAASSARSSASPSCSAVIYGLYWVLKQVKASRKDAPPSGDGLETVATLPLGTNRSLHLVRAGRELVLLGVAEQRRHADPRATARRRRARSACSSPDDRPTSSTAPRAGRSRRRPQALRDTFAAPPAAHGRSSEGRRAATRSRSCCCVGGITLVPALLFTVTGFTRILIVLGFIRSGLGTPTAPPNQVLVGIAFFLTLFVMSPTFNADQERRLRPAAEGHRSRRPGAQARAGAAARVHVQADARRRTSRCSSSSAKLENVQDARRHPDRTS